MSTEPEPPKPTHLPLDVSSATVPTKVDESAAHLERLLQRESDERREERFYWVVVSTVLLDGLIAPAMGPVSFIPIFALQLVILAGLAIRLGVDHFAVPLMRIFERFAAPANDKTKDSGGDKKA